MISYYKTFFIFIKKAKNSPYKRDCFTIMYWLPTFIYSCNLQAFTIKRQIYFINLFNYKLLTFIVKRSNYFINLFNHKLRAFIIKRGVHIVNLFNYNLARLHRGQRRFMRLRSHTSTTRCIYCNRYFW